MIHHMLVDMEGLPYARRTDGFATDMAFRWDAMLYLLEEVPKTKLPELPEDIRRYFEAEYPNEKPEFLYSPTLSEISSQLRLKRWSLKSLWTKAHRSLFKEVTSGNPLKFRRI